MGLFCKTQKTQEVIIDFNYEEMMAAAKLNYSKHHNDPKKSIHIYKYENERDYWISLYDLLTSIKFSFVHKTQTSSSDTNEKYEKTKNATNYIGVYNKNNKLLLTFEIDLDKLILIRYLMNDIKLTENISKLYEKIDMQPIKNVELNEYLSSNYLTEDVISALIYHRWELFSNDITNDYVRKAIKMYTNLEYQK